MGAAARNPRPSGGSNGAYVYFPRPDMQRMLPEKPMVVRTKNLKPEVVVMKPAQELRAG